MSELRDAYIGLGANLGQPAVQVRAAIESLRAVPDITDVQVSHLYRSVAIGIAHQPDYCNAVCRVRTALAPQALFAVMIAIERAAGRVRDGTRWGPRVLDLDLLHVEGVQLNSATLTLPHPELARRNFVLQPLCEIAPNLVMDGVGWVRELAQALGQDGLSLWRDENHLL